MNNLIPASECKGSPFEFLTIEPIMICVDCGKEFSPGKGSLFSVRLAVVVGKHILITCVWNVGRLEKKLMLIFTNVNEKSKYI